MKEIYGLPNEDRIKIIKQHQAGTNKWLTVPGIDRPVINATREQYLLAGWVLKVDVVNPGTHEKQGPVVITATEYSYPSIPWTQKEINDEATRIEQEEIRQLKLDSPYLLNLVGKDNAWIDNKIDTLVSGTQTEIVAGIKKVLKDQVYVDRDTADLLVALHKLGKI